jgi:hypothetical protein
MYNASGASSSPSGSVEQNLLKPFSCTICRQRKVKCNRTDPCSNCVKAAVPCTFAAPAPSRRRKRKPAQEGLHARLNRYERILQSYGAKIDASDMQERAAKTPTDDDMEIVPEDGVSETIKPEGLTNDKAKQAKLVSQHGKSRYLEK